MYINWWIGREGRPAKRGEKQACRERQEKKYSTLLQLQQMKRNRCSVFWLPKMWGRFTSPISIRIPLWEGRVVWLKYCKNYMSTRSSFHKKRSGSWQDEEGRLSHRHSPMLGKWMITVRKWQVIPLGWVTGLTT